MVVDLNDMSPISAAVFTRPMVMAIFASTDMPNEPMPKLTGAEAAAEASKMRPPS